MQTSSTTIRIPAVLAAALSLSCSAASGDPGGGEPAPGGGAGGGNTGGASSGGAAGTGGLGLDSGGGGGGLDEDAACDLVSSETQAAPASLLFLLDYSWSMCQLPHAASLDCASDPAQSKWGILTEAMRAAIEALPSASYSGLVHYPLATDSATICAVAAAPSVPLALTGGAGSAQRQSLLAAMPPGLTDSSPVAQTPTADAAQAMYTYLAAIPLALVPASRFLIVITDGKATCGNTGAQLLAAVTAAAAATPPARTFVVGVPGSEGFRAELSQAAQAGGTAPVGCSPNGPTYCHFDMTPYSTPSELATKLGAALADIQGMATCDYEIPAGPGGGTIDFGRVNVRYTRGAGGQEELPQDSACATGGWRYDDPGKPSRIVLCPATCSQVQADAGARVDVLFGCPTIVR
ncbi:MAG: hypothetical protein IT376_07710 [Polyangiaceae bacterium]|nr:hypothetical protein [Polyangiaceae bacterium]